MSLPKNVPASSFSWNRSPAQLNDKKRVSSRGRVVFRGRLALFQAFEIELGREYWINANFCSCFSSFFVQTASASCSTLPFFPLFYEGKRIKSRSKMHFLTAPQPRRPFQFFILWYFANMLFLFNKRCLKTKYLGKKSVGLVRSKC